MRDGWGEGVGGLGEGLKRIRAKDFLFRSVEHGFCCKLLFRSSVVVFLVDGG